MSIKISVPTMLRHECRGNSELPTQGETVRSALDDLERNFPGLYRSVCDETGSVRQHVSLFLNNDLIKKPDGLNAPLASGDVLTIMPAVSGG